MLPVVPTLCWLALWGSINTSPWDIDLNRILSGWTGAFNGVRATLPLVVLPIWILHLLARSDTRMREPTLPEWLWFFYAVVCLVASIGVENWFASGYWGLAFIATLGAGEMYLAECGGEVAGAASLNRLSWIAAVVILAIVVYVSRGHLLEDTGEGLTGYGVNVRMRTVAGMAMLRPTGISRFGGAVAIVACAAMWRAERWTRVTWLALFAGCAWLVWVMQSRGSLVGFVAALGVVMLLLGGRARTIGILALVLTAGSVSLNFVSHETLHYIWRHATRHDLNLMRMTGRTDIFQDAWLAILRAPIIGYGPQGDRRIIFANAQNGVLYALLCGGFLGGGAWTLGFAIALVYLARALWRPDIVPVDDSMLFAQVAGLMVFFTLRTIPENTAALFSVDLMLQLPAMVYLGVLIRAANLRNASEAAETLATTRGAASVAFDARAYR
ncbi:MAG: O-antigen ligase family protein [Candidatus Binatus sp.]